MSIISRLIEGKWVIGRQPKFIDHLDNSEAYQVTCLAIRMYVIEFRIVFILAVSKKLSPVAAVTASFSRSIAPSTWLKYQ